MDVKLIAVATILLTACSSSEEREHDALMDQIEKQVRLPDGARPLTEYARYYTSDRDGRGFAVYTTFREPKFDTFNLEPGKRRWVSNPFKMPAISEGGCGVIEVEFDLSTATIARAECNERA